MLHALYDESLVPSQVADASILLTTTAKSGWKHDDVAIAAEGAFHYCWQGACLFAYLVDGNAEGCESIKVHEQVVHQVFYLALVVLTDDPAECYAVDGTEGVVADKGAESSVGGEVFSSFYVDCDAYVVDNASTEVDAYSSLSQIDVDEFLMYDACQE
jgi:hypothetical protein